MVSFSSKKVYIYNTLRHRFNGWMDGRARLRTTRYEKWRMGFVEKVQLLLFELCLPYTKQSFLSLSHTKHGVFIHACHIRTMKLFEFRSGRWEMSILKVSFAAAETPKCLSDCLESVSKFFISLSAYAGR